MEYLSFWYAALAADIGIAISTNDRERMRSALNSAKAAALDPDLEPLSVCNSPNSRNELWIVKNVSKRGRPREGEHQPEPW